MAKDERNILKQVIRRRSTGPNPKNWQPMFIIPKKKPNFAPWKQISGLPLAPYGGGRKVRAAQGIPLLNRKLLATVGQCRRKQPPAIVAGKGEKVV